MSTFARMERNEFGTCNRNYTEEKETKSKF